MTLCNVHSYSSNEYLTAKRIILNVEILLTLSTSYNFHLKSQAPKYNSKSVYRERYTAQVKTNYIRYKFQFLTVLVLSSSSLLTIHILHVTLVSVVTVGIIFHANTDSCLQGNLKHHFYNFLIVLL